MTQPVPPGTHSNTPPPGDFSYDITRDRGAVVLTVHGRIDLARSNLLGGTLGDLIDGQGNLNVVVELGDVTHLDRCGLGVFAVAAALLKRRGGDFTLRGDATGSSTPGIDADTAATSQHVVAFYPSDQVLAEAVGRWVVPALLTDDAAIVVATREHRPLFAAAICGAGVDLETVRAEGRYLEIDAEEMLSLFMVDGRPDRRLFTKALGGLVSQALDSGRGLRIYGEMVTVLWQEGNIPAAMALESLWNDLAARRPFALLCGYPIDAFDGQGTGGSFRAICDQHAPATER